MHVEIDFEVDFSVSHVKARYSFRFKRKHRDYVLLWFLQSRYIFFDCSVTDVCSWKNS